MFTAQRSARNASSLPNLTKKPSQKMATQAAPTVVADVTALEKVREDLTCPVCTDLLNTPKTLPCLHTFCEKCLSDAEEARRKMTVNAGEDSCSENAVLCPVCRNVSNHEKGVMGIITNFTYASMVEHIKIRDQVVSNDELRCGKCKEDVDPKETRAVAFCYDCATALCEFCHQMHKRSKDLSKHSFCSLEEIRESKQIDVPSVQRTYECRKHKGEELKLYCITCSEVICRDCTVTARDHRDHSYDFISQVIESEKADIEKHIKPLKEVLTTVENASKRVQVRIDQIKEIQERRTEKINKTVGEAVKILEGRKTSLMDEASRVFKAKSKNLDAQFYELDTAMGSISSAVDFAATTLEKGSDIEVLMYKKELIARAASLCQMPEILPLEVTEEDNVRFVCDSEGLETLGKLCQAPCAEQSEAEGPGFDDPMQGEDTTVTVLARDSKGKQLMNGGGACYAEIQCVPSTTKKSETSSAKVTDNNDGTYTVAFTPHHPGPNKLQIKFDEVEIKGSPYEFDVVRNYSRPLPEPSVFTIPNASPWGLAMVSDTELAITASDCLVHIYNIKGDELHIIKSNFTRPYGISTDEEGFLWITDREAHNVQKFKRSGNVWEKIFQFGQRGVNAGQFSHPRGIAVHPTTGYVYISDMKNNRIQIFKPDNPTPKYHSQFGSPGKNPGLFNLPAGICFDREGRLIVCDDHNCRLQVFDAEGTFLYTLGTTSTQKGLLCSPIGIAADKYGRYIVTEFGSHCVSFLDPSGEILNCIRTIGKGYGQFVHPRGVTVDSVGYVYIADNENMRIVRF